MQKNIYSKSTSYELHSEKLHNNNIFKFFDRKPHHFDTKFGSVLDRNSILQYWFYEININMTFLWQINKSGGGLIRSENF